MGLASHMDFALSFIGVISALPRKVVSTILESAHVRVVSATAFFVAITYLNKI